MKVVFDSQRTLLAEKIDSKLDEKEQEFSNLIDAKIKELKDVSKQTKADVATLQLEKQRFKEVLAEVNAGLADLDKTKRSLLTELNSELIKLKSNSQEYITETEQRLKEIDARVGKTLEMESQVAEGLVREAEQKIAGMTEEKSEALIAGIRIELDKMMDARRNLETAIEKRLTELDELRDAMKRDYDPEKFKDTMHEMDTFKKQFIRVIEQNVDKFNDSIQNLNEKGQEIEKQTNSRIRRIDRKLKELDNFERNFASEMGIALEKLVEKKAKRRKKKS